MSATFHHFDARRALVGRACALLLLLGSSTACGDDDAASPKPGDDHKGDAAVADDRDAAVVTGPAVDGLLIKLKDGELQGDMAGGARRFLKIPFAKPPLGPLRWKAPVRNDPWQGVRHETEFALGCAQLADQGAPASANEDCLYLNVWSPEPAPDKAPVMVWIHGGGNFSGGAGIPIPTTQQLWYDGRVFAERHGIVLVTIQYRLGPLGFLAHPALADEGQPVGNQGLLDQRFALQWVRDNIAKFGGDPGKVTLFGESAGSADVCYHVASPGSRGLFHRAISQSGGCTIRSVGPERLIKDAAAQMTAFAEAAGCKAGKDQLSCLRDVPVEDLLANSMQPMPGAGEVSGGAKWSFAAVLDGPKGFLPDNLQALFDRGDIADVPYLLGSNNDEGATFVLRATPLTSQDEYMADLKERYGDAAPSVANAYPPSAFAGDYNLARARVIGDSGVVCSTHDTARRAAKAGRKVFMYNFNVPWAIAPDALHAGHAGEISHVFGTPYLAKPDPDSEQVAAGMNAYWARFAATGDPNASDAPAVWPQFKPDADKRLQLDPSWKVVDNFRTEECAFWRKYNGAE
jgi:para-nitrobenzyl esterase